MTKEELEKEAEEYVKQNYCEMCVMADDCKSGCIDCFTVQAYIASAEPRKKHIAELEAQIEKMKNWCNCKNYQKCLIELAEQGKGMKPSECCVNCKKWEIKEK